MAVFTVRRTETSIVERPPSVGESITSQELGPTTLRIPSLVPSGRSAPPDRSSARWSRPPRSVGPPALDDLAVAVMAGADDQQFEVVARTCLERPHDAGRDADGVELRDLDDRVVELAAAGAREHEVDLLRLVMLVPERLPLAGPQAVE